MPYIERDGQGNIVGVFAIKQTQKPEEEFIAEDAPELLALLASQEDTPEDNRRRAYIAESDALVIRAVRLQLAGDPGADAAKDEALAKVAEIKTRIPDLEAK